MIHSQAKELLATFATVSMSLLAGSFKNLPKLLTVFYVKVYLLKLMSYAKSLGLPKSLILAAHQSVYIFRVLSFFIFYLGAGSISRQRPCNVSLTAMGGFIIDLI
jgi:hypothetical protein